MVGTLETADGRRRTAVGKQRLAEGEWQKTLLSFTFCRLLSAVCRLSFWFACSLAVIGTIWRSPLASIILIAIFLVLLVTVEWVSRRLTSRTLPSPSQESETVRQQMSRTTTTEGLDRFEGTFWVEFPTDALTTTVHVPFCPAFGKVPKVQTFPADATAASLRIVSLKTFGVRIDVKRNNPEDARLCIAIVAEGQPKSI